MCNESDYAIDWWPFAPFTFAGEEQQVEGIMVDAFREASAACCGGKQLQFGANASDNTVHFSQEAMLANVTHRNILALPVVIPSTVAAMKPSEYFIRMVDSTGKFLKH